MPSVKGWKKSTGRTGSGGSPDRLLNHVGQILDLRRVGEQALDRLKRLTSKPGTFGGRCLGGRCFRQGDFRDLRRPCCFAGERRLQGSQPLQRGDQFAEGQGLPGRY